MNLTAQLACTVTSAADKVEKENSAERRLRPEHIRSWPDEVKKLGGVSRSDFQLARLDRHRGHE
jgi:hypothetical protein